MKTNVKFVSLSVKLVLIITLVWPAKEPTGFLTQTLLNVNVHSKNSLKFKINLTVKNVLQGVWNALNLMSAPHVLDLKEFLNLLIKLACVKMDSFPMKNKMTVSRVTTLVKLAHKHLFFALNATPIEIFYLNANVYKDFRIILKIWKNVSNALKGALNARAWKNAPLV